MTRSIHRPLPAIRHRGLMLAGAALLGLAGLSGATAVEAQSSGGAHYSATLAQAPTEARNIAGGLVWNCSATTCTAPRSASTPAAVCARLARELGTVTAFAVEGRAFAAADLDRCNASAR